jgi:glycosyltransferase involved in cell wall biosynthesis
VLDSESVDESKAICKKYGIEPVNIPQKEFNHGLTRNKGAALATGDLLYFTVQDAWIAEADMLQRMAQHFSDAAVQSVTGMQAIPHEPDKNPALWFKRMTEPVPGPAQFPPGEFAKLSGRQQIAFCRWDNVNSMYRATALKENPFTKTNLSEDIIWAKDALTMGWKIVKDPALLVYHYHHHSFRYNFRVNYAVFYADKKIFHILPAYPHVFVPLLKRAKVLFNSKQLSFPEKAGWFFHNAGIFASHTAAVIIFRAVSFFGGQRLLSKSLHFFCAAIPQGKQFTKKNRQDD